MPRDVAAVCSECTAIQVPTAAGQCIGGGQDLGSRPAVVEHVRWIVEHNRDAPLDTVLPAVQEQLELLGYTAMNGPSPGLSFSIIGEEPQPPAGDEFLRAKALILLAQCMKRRTDVVDPNETCGWYGKAIAECPSWYKGYCLLGNLCLQVHESSGGDAEGEGDESLIDYDAASTGVQSLMKALTMRRGQTSKTLPRLTRVWDEVRDDLSRKEAVDPDLLEQEDLATAFQVITGSLGQLLIAGDGSWQPFDRRL